MKKLLVLLLVLCAAGGTYWKFQGQEAPADYVTTQRVLTDDQKQEADRLQYLKSYSVHQLDEGDYLVRINGGVKLTNNYALELVDVITYKNGYKLIIRENVKGDATISPYELTFPQLQVRLGARGEDTPKIQVITETGIQYRGAEQLAFDPAHVEIATGFFEEVKEGKAYFTVAEGDLLQKKMSIHVEKEFGDAIVLDKGKKYNFTYYLDETSAPWLLNTSTASDLYARSGIIKDWNPGKRRVSINLSSWMLYGKISYGLGEDVIVRTSRNERFETVTPKPEIIGAHAFYVYETDGKEEIIRSLWLKDAARQGTPIEKND